MNSELYQLYWRLIVDTTRTVVLRLTSAGFSPHDVLNAKEEWQKFYRKKKSFAVIFTPTGDEIECTNSEQLSYITGIGYWVRGVLRLHYSARHADYDSLFFDNFGRLCAHIGQVGLRHAYMLEVANLIRLEVRRLFGKRKQKRKTR